MIFDKTNLTKPEYCAEILASAYIAWADGNPIVYSDSDESMWTSPTAKSIYKFLISSPETIRFAEGLISQPDDFFGKLAAELKNRIFKEPYIWGENLDFYKSIPFLKYCRNCEKELLPATVEGWIESDAEFTENFKQYFYRFVIVPLKRKFREVSDKDMFWVEKHHIERMKNECDQRIKVQGHTLEILDKANAELRGKVKCLLIWVVILAYLFVLGTVLSGSIAYHCGKPDNVDAVETSQNFDIMTNPQILI